MIRTKKPLLLRGVRQVGKSSAVRNLSQYFKHYIEVNFELQKDIAAIFENSLEPQQICSKLSAIYGIPIIPGQTLVFFDEIQACIPAISSLRFFFEKCSELHVVAAGSLFEFALSEIPSFGVGRIRSMFMYPFSFDEFLLANNEKLLIEEKRQSSAQNPLLKPLHDKLLDYLKVFLIIGGLPEVVRKYITAKDFIKCQEILNDLVITYTDDFAKYKKRFSPLITTNVFNTLAKNSGSKFVYSTISENVKSYQVKEAIALLTKAGMVIPVTHTAANGIPLGADTNEKFRKFLIFDTGIQQVMLGLNIGEILLHNEFEVINKGFIAETFAGLELLKYNSCYQRDSLYYWQREEKSGNAEVDYVILQQNEVVPIEIKSGTKGSMQSMQYFMQKKNLYKGIRCSTENFGKYANIEIVPLYAISNLL